MELLIFTAMDHKTTIFGIHSLNEALNSNQPVDKIFVQKGLDNEPANRLLSQAQNQNIPISQVPVQKLEKIASSGNHQGIAAKISPIQLTPLESLVEPAFQNQTNPLFLLCDGISDVRNFGAIVRTAECAGASGVIIPKQGSAAINEQSVKTSAGAIFNIPICKVHHLKDAVFFLKSYDVQFIAAREKSTSSVYDVNFQRPSALIMGSEGKGVSKALLKQCDIQAKLPLLGKTDSLNVSVACAIFLYEAVRQKMDQPEDN